METAANRVGSQSLVGVIDVKTSKFFQKKEAVLLNGRKSTGQNPGSLAAKLENMGVGEILLNSVDRDGMMNGYDLELIESVKSKITVPLTVSGGAGSLDDIRELINRFPIIGAAAGSLFVFKGKYRAVMINYPTHSEREYLLGL